MRLTVAALALLATASCARQKYKGAPPEALHTAILHGGGVEGVDHELKRGAKLKGRDAQSREARQGRVTKEEGAAEVGAVSVCGRVERKWLSPSRNNGAGRRLSCPAGGLRLHVAQRLLDHAVEAVLEVGAQHFGRDARLRGGGRLVGWGVLFLVGHCRSSHDLRSEQAASLPTRSSGCTAGAPDDFA